MAEEKIQKTEEKKEEKVSKNEDSKTTEISQAKDNKSIDKKEKKADKKIEIKKKYEAIVNGQSLRASKKHCMYICNFIKNKKIDDAIADLQSVIKMKIAIPFKGEIPHRKGNMMSGRYPVKTSKQFIPLLQSLKGNAIVNGLDIDKVRIVIASPSWASRPLRKGSVEAKRTNVILIAKEIKLNPEKRNGSKKK